MEYSREQVKHILEVAVALQERAFYFYNCHKSALGPVSEEIFAVRKNEFIEGLLSVKKAAAENLLYTIEEYEKLPVDYRDLIDQFPLYEHMPVRMAKQNCLSFIRYFEMQNRKNREKENKKDIEPRKKGPDFKRRGRKKQQK